MMENKMKDKERKGKEVPPNHLNVIRTNLPLVTNYCGMKPYTGNYDYASLRTYIDQAEK